MKTQIAASLLAANQLYLAEELASIENVVHRLHLDVMDGHFVPNLALGTDVIKAIPAYWKRDIHLMVTQPENVTKWLDLRAGDTVYFHPQTMTQPQHFIEMLDARDIIPGFAINLDFPLEESSILLSQVDTFLVMGVSPGFSGQTMDENTTKRIVWLRNHFPQATIAVDGGVNAKNAKVLVENGANILVIGTYLFSANDRKEAIGEIIRS